MISRVSFNTLQNISFKGGAGQAFLVNTLERKPDKDTVNFTSNAEMKISPERKKELDTTVYDFEMEDGSVFSGTVKEYLEASIIRWNKTNEGTLYHVPSTVEIGEKILKEGLDWTKNSRSQAGPGTYFSPSLGCGEFSGLGYQAIEAVYKGKRKKYPVMEKGFYDRLIEAAPISRAEYREIMMNDLGVDFLYSGTGRAGGAYVVLNDNCMSLKKGW